MDLYINDIVEQLESQNELGDNLKVEKSLYHEIKVFTRMK